MTGTTTTGGWAPYDVRACRGGWVLTVTDWVRVPDGRGCTDWDTVTEDDDPDAVPEPDRAVVQAMADRLNAAYREREAERRARQLAAPLP